LIKMKMMNRLQVSGFRFQVSGYHAGGISISFSN